MEHGLAEMLKQVYKSIVGVGRGRKRGTGFVCLDNGLIMTNQVIVGDDDKVKVHIAKDRTIWADVLEADTKQEFALLLPHESTGIPPLQWATAGSARVGMKVYAVGHPYGYGYATACGVISGISRENGGMIYFKTDAEPGPGSAGGPLVNEQGQVIGANAYLYDGTSLGFALPAERIKGVLAQHQGSLEEIRQRALSPPAAGSFPTTVSTGYEPFGGARTQIPRDPLSAQTQSYADLVISFLLTELGYDHFIDDGMWVIARSSGEIWITISPDQTRIIFSNRLVRLPGGQKEAFYHYLLTANDSKVGDCKLSIVRDVVTLSFHESLTALNHTRVMSRLSFLLAVGEELRMTCMKQYNALPATTFMEERYSTVASIA
jgi:hypothetical protein